MSNINESGRLAGVVRGAIYGKPYTEVTQVFSPSEYPKHFPPNPDAPILLDQLSAITLAANKEDFFPWSTKRVDIHNLFKSLVTFADDHDERVPREYFPVDESHHLIEKIISTSRKVNAPLELPQQLEIGLDLSDGRVLAAAVLCHSASRAVGRNRDQKIDPSFKFTADTMQQWSSSIARFNDTKQYDPPGDTYHFWATFSMGMALRKSLSKEPTACLAYGTLFYYGADVMDVCRKLIARNPLRYKHMVVDRMGLKIGWKLGE